MKQLNLLILAFLLSAPAFSSDFTCKKIDADKVSEINWIPIMKMDEQSLLSYAMVNTDESIVIMVMANDPLLQKKIIRFGLNFWIDPTASKKKSFCVQYPLDRSKEWAAKAGESAGAEQGAKRLQPEFHEIKDRVLEGSVDMLLKGFSEEEEIIGVGEMGYSGQIYFDDLDRIWIQIVIPFSAFKNKLANDFSVILETGSISMEEIMAMRHSAMKSSGKSGKPGKKSKGGSPADFEYMQTPSKVTLKTVSLSK